jgi:hypothetical protein
VPAPRVSKQSVSFIFSHQNPVDSPMCATCSTLLILPNFITLIIFGKECKSRSSSLRDFLHPPVSSLLLGSDIFLSTLFHPPYMHIQVFCPAHQFLLRAGGHISAAPIVLMLPYCLLDLNAQGYIQFLGIQLGYRNTVEYLQLTPWSRVLLEKLTGPQLVKKFPAFYGTRRFITTFTTVRHLSLS